jgi:hypothetical protein
MATGESPKITDSWWSNLGALIVIWLVIHWVGDAWHNKLRYSIQYSVSYDQVTVANKPHNCEWFSAPLGDKNCHYDPQVQVIRTGHREGTGVPIISFDNGKTWGDNDFPKPVVPAVNVTWEKIED